MIVAAEVSRQRSLGFLIVAARQLGVSGDCRADWRPSGPTLAIEGSAAAIALDVHLADGGVVDEAADDGEGHRLVGKILPHSSKGWLAVTSKDRRSYRAPISSKSTLVSA